MSGKSKKTGALWFKCEKCEANIVQKDLEIHHNNCPPSNEIYVHPFVWRGLLNGPLEIKANEDIKGLDFHDKNNLVFISQSAIKLCSLVIGDWIVLKTTSQNVAPCAKIVWPTSEKPLSSILITQTAFDFYWKGSQNIKVSISKLNVEEVKTAKQIFLIALNAPKVLQFNNELNLRIKKLHINRMVTEGNKLSCVFFGKNLEFLIKEVETTEAQNVEPKAAKVPVKNLEAAFENMLISTENVHFYQITNDTSFKLIGDDKLSLKRQININPLSVIGGLDKEVIEIQDLVDVALGKVPRISGIKVARGILLYGSPGTGKTTIMHAIAYLTRCNVITINGPDFYSKFTGETETALNSLFSEAYDNAPSVILLDEMDYLCPARSSRITEQEKRIVSIILNHFDNLHQSDNNKICILATSNKPDAIEPAFRRCGRLDREIEIPSPNPLARLQILKKLLSKTDHRMTENDLKEIANGAHGFVGSDLVALCTRAGMRAVKRFTDKMDINMDDFKYALTRVRPSAMREIQIEVPDVKWSDIGGQDELKLILKQAVEWPLKYSEKFVHMGISPSRGVLMFGPPGCSKTMIAKAVATESGLNFISIKGPELFNKWVGESERAVRDVFRKARQVSPSIIFFDEIDAIGGERSGGSTSGGTSVQERVLAQLLTELDGITPLGDVTIIAATNRPDRIDRALLRPGRLDRIVYVPLPDVNTRREIFTLKTSKMPIKDIDVEELVKATEGYSGAEIQAVCYEAAMKALEENINAENVIWSHFEKALQIVTPRTSEFLLQIYKEYIKNN